MPTPYKIIQPRHDGSGRTYQVTVEGDTNYIQDGTNAVEVGPDRYVLPYKSAPSGNTQWVNVFNVPYRCDMREPQIDISVEAKAGSTGLGGPKYLKVHDAT